jgi:peptidoglycan-associated lipoprotein
MKKALLLALSFFLITGCLKKQTLKQEEILQPQAPAQTSARPDTAVMQSAQPRMMLAPVHFEYDSSRVTDDSRARLDALADTLAKYPAIALRIEGHCDEHGSDRYNFALAGQRALAVRDYLAAKGVAAARLPVASIGKQRPASLDTTDAGRARNRRVEFVLLPALAQ